MFSTRRVVESSTYMLPCFRSDRVFFIPIRIVKDFSQLIQEHFGTLTAGELSQVHSYFREETLQKNEYFTRSDKICDRLSIVTSGILRVYALSEDGKEITQWISTENFLVTEVAGFFFNQPNRWNIRAFTDTTLLTITKTDYHKLCATFPKWHAIEKRFIVKCFAMIEDRIFAHLSMTAGERYRQYFQQHSELFNQVPLQHIASVLGMTPETLSRIRKRQRKSS